MSDSLSFEKELYDQYKRTRGKDMDEMKMHKLMYFTQRESLMLSNMTAFDENFYGWRYGPVLKSVRYQYGLYPGNPYLYVQNSLTAEEKELVYEVLLRYGDVSSWRLSEMTHAEYSWKRSRKGLKSFENGDVMLDTRAMKVDAARELSARNNAN